MKLYKLFGVKDTTTTSVYQKDKKTGAKFEMITIVSYISFMGRTYEHKHERTVHRLLDRDEALSVKTFELC